MLRILLDVNILISALIKRGKPRELWLKAVRKEYTLISSERILADFIRTSGRAKFSLYIEKRDVADFLQAFHSTVKIVNVRSNFKIVDSDPDDNVILNTAYDGKVDYVVTGDDHLLTLKEFKKIKIVSVGEMLDVLQ